MVKAQALAQTASIDELFRTVDEISGQLRGKRLELDKLVKSRKEAIRIEIVQAGKTAYNAHIEALKVDTGGPWIVLPPPDFAGKIKGLRTVTSIRDAVDTELARAKIEANESAMKIKANLAVIKEAGNEFLFSDKLALIGKPIDDLRLLIKSRVTEHEAAEAKRIEAEREKIRQEEVAKLQREADERASCDATAAQQRAQPAPEATPALVTPIPAWSLAPTAEKPTSKVVQMHPKRPTDEEIINVLATHFRAQASVVRQWLSEMEFVAA